MTRYTVTLDAQIYAHDDEHAKTIARKFAKRLDNYWGYEDNKARVIKLTERLPNSEAEREVKL